MLVSLIVPCFNESLSIPFFYEELCKVSKGLPTYDFEFLFIDDGSSDNTLDVLCSYAEKDTRVKYISFSRNFGKEAAMYAGFCNCKGDYVAVMDADMQDPPSLLPEMLKILESNEYDSVATRRVTRDGEPRLRSFFARTFYRIINKISDADVVDGARDFRLMKRAMVDVIVKMCEHSRFSKGIFGWIGFRTYWLPYKNVERVAGETKWNFWKLFKYSIDGIINFSQAPLTIAFWSGTLCMLSSFILAVFFIVRRFAFSIPIDGWVWAIFALLLVSSIQLFTVGILGQYLAKIHFETKKRPHYIVAKTNAEDVL